MAGASAVWKLREGNFRDAETLIVTDTAPDILVSTDDAGAPQLLVTLEPADTADLYPGVYHHQAKVVLAGGNVSHIETGAFVLRLGNV
jgi:hypothetical protein